MAIHISIHLKQINKNVLTFSSCSTLLHAESRQKLGIALTEASIEARSQCPGDSAGRSPRVKPLAPQAAAAFWHTHCSLSLELLETEPTSYMAPAATMAEHMIASGEPQEPQAWLEKLQHVHLWQTQAAGAQSS